MNEILSVGINEILKWIAAVVAAASVFVEFTPKIKINPISAILGWIGERVNKGMYTEISQLKKKIDEISTRQEKIEADIEEREAISCRIRILRFSDELRREIPHSQESFEQTISDVDTYERYCNEHPEFKNNKTVVAKDRVITAYKDRKSVV